MRMLLGTTAPTIFTRVYQWEFKSLLGGACVPWDGSLGSPPDTKGSSPLRGSNCSPTSWLGDGLWSREPADHGTFDVNLQPHKDACLSQARMAWGGALRETNGPVV